MANIFNYNIYVSAQLNYGSRNFSNITHKWINFALNNIKLYFTFIPRKLNYIVHEFILFQ